VARSSPTQVVATVDRLLHRVTSYNIRGRSYRMRAHQEPAEQELDSDKSRVRVS